ncbi:MAG: DMT family transporter [Clostridia bacterium]|nr:DMT family transporter [Clostridia bacterium]
MKKSYIYASISILCWSTVAVVTKILLGSLNSFQILWASSFFAGLFLLIVNIANGNILKLKKFKPKDYILAPLIALPGTFLYYVFYYNGADRMLASQAFIINYLWPMMSVIFACILLKERFTPRKIVAIILSFLGVAIVTGGELATFHLETVFGACLCILCAVSYGVFTALNQKIHYEKFLSMMLGYFATFLLTTIINLCNNHLFIPDFTHTLGFLWNGMFTMALANTLWVIALQSGETAKISNLAYITPFLALVWTSLILKEPFSIFSLLGLTVIVLGILLQLKDKKQG